MAKNRFKSSGPTIDFNDPSVLTVVPAAVQEEPVKEEGKPDPVVVEEVKETPIAEEAPVNNVLSKIQKKPEGKSCSFYLDVDVLAAIEKVAKQNKISKSQLVEAVLRDYLIK